MESAAPGLAKEEAAKRFTRYGPNELPVKDTHTLWNLVLQQFKDFTILVLAAAAVVAGISGEMSDALLIAAIILLNAAIGFFQEYKAGKAIEALKKMDRVFTTVMGSGHPCLVAAAELVPGDMVMLETGNIAPTDLYLLKTIV